MSRNHWVPNQHGAWAMLVVPALIGAIRSGGAWVQVPLMAFWLVGYFAFFAAGTWLRSGRKARFVRPVIVYGVVAAFLGVVVALLRPDLVLWAPALVPLAAASLWFSSRRRDRSVANDVVTILAACLFGAVMDQAGASWDATVRDGGLHVLLVATTAYFVGTVLYVKTLIRERTNTAFHRWSVGYHAAWTLLWGVGAASGWPAAGRGWWSTALFAGLTVRAAVLAGRRLRPRDVGLGELLPCVALVALAVTWPR